MRGALRALAELYPRALRLFWLAPLSVALVVVPEFLQHVVEMRIGMFESRDAFKALQLDPTRMALGYAKIAGLLLAMLATARFWWTREQGGGPWWDLRRVAWGRFLVGFLIFFGIGSLPELAKGHVPDSTHQIAGTVWAILLLPFLFLTLAGLFGDRATPVGAMIKRSWPWLLLTAVLAVIGFAPLAWLHGKNHDWAMVTAPPVDWALMVFDSLLVGMLAAITGTALYLGYTAFAERAGNRAASR